MGQLFLHDIADVEMFREVHLDLGDFASGRWRKIARTERGWRVIDNDREDLDGWWYEWIEGVYVGIIRCFIVIIVVIIVVFIIFIVLVVNNRWCRGGGGREIETLETFVRRDAVIFGFEVVVCGRGRSRRPGFRWSLFDIGVRVHDESDVGKGIQFICFVHVGMKKVREGELGFVELGFVLR